jgi:hypothetical protein
MLPVNPATAKKNSLDVVMRFINLRYVLKWRREITGELWRSTSKLERLSLPTIRLLLPIISRSVSLMLNLG